MCQINQGAFQSMEHYKISDNLGLRMIDIQYNINDYLPRDYEYKFNHAFQSNHKEYVDKLVLKAKTDDGLGGDDASYKELISSLSETIREKETQIQGLTKKIKQQQICYEDKFRKTNVEVEDLLQKISLLQTANNTNKRRVQQYQQHLKKQRKERKLIEQQLHQTKKQNEKKFRNIRIFCQKYQIAIQPKKKQIYTIQVQTQKQQRVGRQQINYQQLPNDSRVNTYEPISHRKISSRKKSQFFQLYQQQLIQHNDKNDEITSRSQVFLSNNKPKKPTFLFNDQCANQKQNNKKKINQRIDGKDKSKNKIKYQEIQICPIDQNYIQDIVKSILINK